MQTLGLLLLIAAALFLSALPVWYGAKTYCASQSLVKLYFIVWGGGLLAAILIGAMFGFFYNVKVQSDLTNPQQTPAV